MYSMSVENYRVSGLLYKLSATINHTEDGTGVSWHLIWLPLDGFVSLALLITKIVILMGVPMADWIYLHKVCFIANHSWGAFYALVRLLTSLWTLFSLQFTTGRWDPLCYALVQLPILGFNGYFSVTAISNSFLAFSTIKPLRKGLKYAKVSFSVGNAIVILWSLVSLHGLTQDQEWLELRIGEVHCTWTILPEWYINATVFGLITLAFGYSLVIAVCTYFIAWSRRKRIADETMPRDPQKDSVTCNSKSRRISNQLYAVFNSLMPVTLYIERGLKSNHQISTIASWIILSVLVLLSDICTLQNKSLTSGVTKLWKRWTSR